MAYDHNKYATQYTKENYDQVVIKLPKGSRAKLQKLATDLNFCNSKGAISVTRLVAYALEKLLTSTYPNRKSKVPQSGHRNHYAIIRLMPKLKHWRKSLCENAMETQTRT